MYILVRYTYGIWQEPRGHLAQFVIITAQICSSSTNLFNLDPLYLNLIVTSLSHICSFVTQNHFFNVDMKTQVFLF